MLDLQLDFVGPEAKLPVPRPHADDVVAAANAIIDAASTHAIPVAYVRNEFAPGSSIGNWVRRGAAIQGSPGSAMDPRVRMVSDVVFSKSASSAFSNPVLEEWLRREGVGHLVVLGVFAHACICQTVRGALRRGYSVLLPREAIGGKSVRGRDDALAGLARRGATVAAVADAVAMAARGDL